MLKADGDESGEEVLSLVEASNNEDLISGWERPRRPHRVYATDTASNT